MLKGALAWQQRGLEPPAAIREATETYRVESDSLAAFIDECCVTGLDYTAQGGELYKAYRQWAEQQGLQKREFLSSTKFGTVMGERFHKEPKRRGKTYFGIGLRQSVTGSESTNPSHPCSSLCSSPTRENTEKPVTPVTPSQLLLDEDHCSICGEQVAYYSPEGTRSVRNMGHGHQRTRFMRRRVRARERTSSSDHDP